MLPEHLDGAHHLLMRDRFGLHNHQHLIHADVLIHLYRPQAAIRIPRDDNAAIRQRIRVKLGYRRPSRAGARIQRYAHLRRLLFVRLVRLPQPPPEVRLQMIRHAAPVLQQLLISADAPRDVRLVRPEECLHGIRRKRPRLAVVRAAERMHIVPPKLGGECPHRLGVSQRLAVYLNLVPQHIHGV